jgi:hypothetical protein
MAFSGEPREIRAFRSREGTGERPYGPVLGLFCGFLSAAR